MRFAFENMKLQTKANIGIISVFLILGISAGYMTFKWQNGPCHQGGRKPGAALYQGRLGDLQQRRSSESRQL